MNLTLTPTHPIYTANDFFKERLNLGPKEKLIKLALDGGFTCPNRDGSLSTEGCIFCSEVGSGDFAANRSLSIPCQIEQMKEKMSPKWGYSGSYMAYFQAFTSTYAPIEVLREKFTAAIDCEGVTALSVATRPDCIDRGVCALLRELSQRVYVCVELGLQTASDKTAELINRCYKTKVYEEAALLLKEYQIDFITHIILGLPGESREDMLDSVGLAAESGSAGLKLQLLHILRDTALEKMYREKPFKVFEYEEYTDFIVDIIEGLPQRVSVHRITGDGDKKRLIAPLWSLDKRRVLNGISRRFIERNTYQGKLAIFNKNST